MNKRTLAELQQAVENATGALEKLEQAMDAHDNRKIGAALYELQRELKKLHALTQDGQS